MKLKTWLSAIVVLIVLALIAVFVLNRPDPSEGMAPVLAGAPTGDSLLSRGEYLTKAADCAACHTVPGGQPYAGGVAFKLPFGTIYSSNITADAANGIGTWSDDDFVRAVQQGVRNDGAHLYPAFPYTSYTALSRGDLLAIKAYLFSLKTVAQATPENKLGFPFNQRWAMAFWNAVFFKQARFKVDTAKSPEWNKGAYLATALGHCGECHTPRNIGFATESSHQLAGGTIEGWTSYDITPDKAHGVGDWTDAELVAYLSTGHAAGRGSASGQMGEVVENSLQYMKPDDISALVTYLRSVPADPGKQKFDRDAKPALMAASSATSPAESELADAGHAAGIKLFEGACSSCHQWNGDGQETPYAALAGARSVSDPEAANILQIMLRGSRMRIHDQDVYMPDFAHPYSDTELAELANAVVWHFGNAAGTVTPKDVEKARNP